VYKCDDLYYYYTTTTSYVLVVVSRYDMIRYDTQTCVQRMEQKQKPTSRRNSRKYQRAHRVNPMGGISSPIVEQMSFHDEVEE